MTSPTISILKKEWKMHHAFFVVAFVAIFAVVFSAFLLMHKDAPAPLPPQYPLPLSLNPSDLQAEAAIVYDPQNGRILFAKNADTPLPLASLTKLMTAYVVLADQNPSTRVTLTEPEVAQINDPGDYGLHAGEVWSIASLIRYGLFASSNNAMNAAATAGGLDATLAAMNSAAAQLGLSQAQFSDATGLDLSTTTPGATASAYDIAKLAADFLEQYPSYFEETTEPTADFGPAGQTFTADPTGAPIQNIPGLIASKTGYTDLAGGNLVAVFDVTLGTPLVAVVLHSTENGRFVDMRTLIDSARGESSSTARIISSDLATSTATSSTQ